jgi:hypothetical protein
MVMTRDDSSWALQRFKELINTLENEYTRPSVVFKVKLVKRVDDLWMAYYGELSMMFDGTTPLRVKEPRFMATGITPDEAMHNFDKLWTANTNKEK